MLTRRQFLRLGAATGVGALLLRSGRGRAALPGGTLDPNSIPKYVRPLVVPPAMLAANATPGLDD